MNAVLHYIHDPFCGWCYGAAPLLRAARGVLPVQAHGGGMMAGSSRQPVTAQLRAYVMPHDRRIAQLTGQPFGRDYFDGLLRDEGAVFDSGPPISAMLAAQRLAGHEAALDLLVRIQSAHFLSGRRVADAQVLADLAVEAGLDQAAFAQAYCDCAGEPTDRHILASRSLLQQVGGAGFPTFALEQSGHYRMLDAGPWLGRPDEWQAWLRAQLGENAAGP